MFILQQLVFSMQKGQQNIMKLQCAFLQFISSQFIILQNTSSSPPFQNFKQCFSQVTFLWSDIPTVPLEYIIREERQLVNTQHHCSHYKWQLHVPATQQPSTGGLCENNERKFYSCGLYILTNDMWKPSWPYIKSYVTVTHKKAFTIKKVTV